MEKIHQLFNTIIILIIVVTQFKGLLKKSEVKIMNNCKKLLLIITIVVFGFGHFHLQSANAHCQIPCGIYDDGGLCPHLCWLKAGGGISGQTHLPFPAGRGQ